MEDFTIISYPGSRNDSLLSLTEARSRYMLPFAGKFRVVDFTLRNSFSSDATSTVIYSNIEDNLSDYVDMYGPFDEKFPEVRVVSRQFSNIQFSYNLILDTNTSQYIIYNGDIPSIIDFKAIMKSFNKKKSDAVLYRLLVNDKPSMAHKLLVIKQKLLLEVIEDAISEQRNPPNIFEMIINIIVNRGVKKSSFNAYYWPIKNVPDYFNLTRKVIWDADIFNLLYTEKIIKSQLKLDGYAQIGEHGKISNSFMSDYCKINGTVENSIIYPGVEIEEKAIIKDSIILPYVKIGRGARITRSIIDERTDLSPEESYNNIGEYTNIGNGEENIKNNDFPLSLFSGITVIGKDTQIVNRANIGGACYVASNLGEEFFTRKKYLYDGLSLIS